MARMAAGGAGGGRACTQVKQQQPGQRRKTKEGAGGSTQNHKPEVKIHTHRSLFSAAPKQAGTAGAAVQVSDLTPPRNVLAAGPQRCGPCIEAVAQALRGLLSHPGLERSKVALLGADPPLQLIHQAARQLLFGVCTLQQRRRRQLSAGSRGRRRGGGEGKGLRAQELQGAVCRYVVLPTTYWAVLGQRIQDKGRLELS